jgi:hypothetical protein
MGMGPAAPSAVRKPPPKSILACKKWVLCWQMNFDWQMDFGSGKLPPALLKVFFLLNEAIAAL